VEKGKFVRGRFFYVWVVPRQELKGESPGKQRPSMGVVVNRKTQPKATDRNILKRQVREVFRKRQGELKEDAAVLIKVREGSKMPEFSEAERELVELFKKAGATK
jgi:ribonuclease P protein component